MRNAQKLHVDTAKISLLDRILDQSAIFLAAASYVAILIATYGLDLSPGFF